MNVMQKNYLKSLNLELNDVKDRKAEYQEKLDGLNESEADIQNQIDHFKKMCETIA
jgi:septation ring formation regulator EzrA